MSILTKHITTDVRWLYGALGFLLAGLPFVFFLGGFNTRSSVEAVMRSRDKLTAVQVCEKDNDFLRGQLAASNEKYDTFRASTSEQLQEYRELNRALSVSANAYAGRYQTERGRTQMYRQEVQHFQTIRDYKTLFARFGEQIADMPAPEDLETVTP